MTPAEQFEARERKQSLFQLSSDPFDVLANRHRQSISGVSTGASAAASRRRSSAIAPDAAAAASHSGYQGDKLAPIESRPEIPPPDLGNTDMGSGSTSDTLNRDSIDPAAAPSTSSGGEHTRYHDATTTGHDHHDPDSVAPHEVR